MADNVQTETVVTPGLVFATDDIAGVHHPKTKMEWGPSDTATQVDTGASALPIQDGGNSITIDATALPLPTGAATAAAQLPDGHNVTVDNAAGAAAVNIQDGGNSITIDGTVTANAGTGAFTVEQSVAANLKTQVAGTKSNNGGAPGLANLGTLPAVATAAAPTYTEGNQVGLSTDLSGNLRTAGGAGGTQYTEDAVAATDPVGTQPVMTRRDTPTALVSANLDVVSQQATNFGAAYVQVVTSGGAFVDTFGGSGGTAQADESAFAEGTTNFTPIGGVLNDTITSDPTEDQAAAARITAKRALHVNLRNASGGELGTTSDPLNIEGSITLPSANTSGTITALDGTVSRTLLEGQGGVAIEITGTWVATLEFQGTVAGGNDAPTLAWPVGGGAPVTSITANGTWFIPAAGFNQMQVKATAFTSGTVNVAIRSATVHAALTEPLPGVDIGDVTINNAAGASAVNVQDGGNSITVDGSVSLAAGTNNIGDVDIASFAAGAITEVQGDVAHDAAAGANPVLVGAQMETMADSAPGTRAGTDGDANKLATTDGAVFTITTGPQAWSYHENSSSALTDASVHTAPGAGLSLYVQTIVVSLGAATALNVFFEESTTTVLGPYYLEAVNGRTLVINFTCPKKITANTALTITTSAAVAHSVDITGFIAPG